MRKIILSLLMLAGPAAAHAQQPDSGSFFVRLGRDTIAVERYARTKNLLVSEALLRTPVTRRMKLTVTFKDDGTVAWWEVLNDPVPGSGDTGPRTRGLVTLVNDSAHVEFWNGGVGRPLRKVAAHPTMMPLQVPFYSTYETALQRWRAAPADTVLSMLAANVPLHYRIAQPRPDSLALFHPQSGTMWAKLDAAGRLQHMNAEGTTFKVVVTRSRPLDLGPWAARFAKADREGKAIGILSPRDTVETHVQSTDLMIDYSRPSKRGRVIFGGIVPWDSVWRTGANAATQLEVTGKTMQIGSTRIPPGKYSLWTIPSKRGWQLIINRQTGQWGTIYDAKQDLARIDVKAESVPVPVELFTIAFEKRAKQPVMTLAWDRTRVVVPFTIVD